MYFIEISLGCTGECSLVVRRMKHYIYSKCKYNILNPKKYKLYTIQNITYLIFLSSTLLTDRPEPPTGVRINSCQTTYADVSWSPGADNNDPITGYVVYFSTSNDAELSVSGAGGQSSSPTNPTMHEAMRVDAGKQSARVRYLAPWNEYTFFVAAVNSVGQSDAAKVTSSSIEEGTGTAGSLLLTCSTPEAMPSRSPNKVCTDSRKSDHLVIVWEVSLCKCTK